MIVSDETANEFLELYHDEYGEKLSLDEAREEASHLLDLFRLLTKAPPNEGGRDQPSRA